MAVIPPGVEHRYHALGSNRIVVADFAADHLESFLKQRLPLTPNSEWQVEVDERRWIHFSRRYAGTHLLA